LSGHDILARLRAHDAANSLAQPARQRLQKSKKSTRKKPEFQLHIAAVASLRKRLPKDACVFHVPMARQGKDVAAARDKMFRNMMGALSGLPDLIVIRAGKVAAIELKAGAGQLSHTQQWCHSLLASCGVPIAVCRTLDECWDFLIEHDFAPADARPAGEALKPVTLRKTA
jgi:hypothetical protein